MPTWKLAHNSHVLYIHHIVDLLLSGTNIQKKIAISYKQFTVYKLKTDY